jgi:hypothetical protein
VVLKSPSRWWREGPGPALPVCEAW